MAPINKTIIVPLLLLVASCGLTGPSTGTVQAFVTLTDPWPTDVEVEIRLLDAPSHVIDKVVVTGNEGILSAHQANDNQSVIEHTFHDVPLGQCAIEVWFFDLGYFTAGTCIRTGYGFVERHNLSAIEVTASFLEITPASLCFRYSIYPQ